MAVEQKDILDALDQMGIYLPDIGTEEEQMKALVGAISTFQSQRKMKKEQEQRAKEEADRQQQIMKSVEQRTFTATTYKFGGGGGGGGSGACNDIRGGYGGAVVFAGLSFVGLYFANRFRRR